MTPFATWEERRAWGGRAVPDMSESVAECFRCLPAYERGVLLSEWVDGTRAVRMVGRRPARGGECPVYISVRYPDDDDRCKRLVDQLGRHRVSKRPGLIARVKLAVPDGMALLDAWFQRERRPVNSWLDGVVDTTPADGDSCRVLLANGIPFCNGKCGIYASTHTPEARSRRRKVSPELRERLEEHSREQKTKQRLRAYAAQALGIVVST